jgi:hypothetical protein
MCSKIDIGVKFVGLGKEENINPLTLDSKNLHKEEGDKEGRTCVGIRRKEKNAHPCQRTSN